MKSLIFRSIKMVLFLCFFGLNSYAQTPQKMSYQAVIRNVSGVLVANTNVGIKISILQGNISGTVVYSEVHTVLTNTNGLALLEIGGGAIESGSFASINWVNGPYFIKTETDPAGGTNYTISGTSQLLSVPYALLSEKTVNPTYPVSVSDNSTTFLIQNARNTWVDDPDISVIVPETGKYLLSFYGNAFNTNEYFGYETSYDTDGTVRVFNNTTSTELLFAFAIRYRVDIESGTNALRKLSPMNPSRTIMVNLTLGDELKLQYQQYAFGNPLPTGNWIVGNGGINILKIGE